MQITEDTIRDLCTDAVFERGETYLSEGRIQQLTRFDDTVTAVVRGSRDYDVRFDLVADEFDPFCSCPYDGSGNCKHVVAVLLRLRDDPPADVSERVDAVLGDAEADDLRAFLRKEFQSDPALLDRFLAQFGESTTQSVAEFRAEVDRLFEETNPEYPVVFEPIDFSELFTLAETYRAQGEFQSAATVYRGLVEGLDDNMNNVDGAYDHFAQAFQRALDGYVECVADANLSADEQEAAVQFLEGQAASGTTHLRDRFRKSADELRERVDYDSLA